MKHEWKKHEKGLYLPKAKPELIEVPPLKFFMVQGEGHPDAPQFKTCVEALYGTSYAVRMAHKGEHIPPGYFEHTEYHWKGSGTLSIPGWGRRISTTSNIL